MNSGTVVSLLVAGSALIPSAGLAWGSTGHEVVCEIAYQELTPKARHEVDVLLQLDPQYRVFFSSCIWADRDENGRRVRGPEHYVNVARNELTFEVPCPEAEACVVSAVLNDMRDLALFGDPEERLRLLKSLGHWIGDLHQPIHVSFEDDRGGNKISVQGACSGNFHELWDTCILEERLGTDARQVAVDLRATITEADREAWLPEDIAPEEVMGWAQESLDITTAPASLYCQMEGDTCVLSNSQKAVDITEAFLDEQAPVVAQRLKQAGVRLGGILNWVFDEDSEDAIPVNLNEVLELRLEASLSPSEGDRVVTPPLTNSLSSARLILTLKAADGTVLGERQIELSGDTVQDVLSSVMADDAATAAEEGEADQSRALLLILD